MFVQHNEMIEWRDIWKLIHQWLVSIQVELWSKRAVSRGKWPFLSCYCPCQPSVGSRRKTLVWSCSSIGKFKSSNYRSESNYELKAGVADFPLYTNFNQVVIIAPSAVLYVVLRLCLDSERMWCSLSSAGLRWLGWRWKMVVYCGVLISGLVGK